jgi:glycosyltransferase 2 family protein
VSKVKRTIWLSLAAGFLVMLVLGLLTDLGETGSALRGMDPRWLPLLLLFSLANYITRFGKWEYFLRKLDIRLPITDSLGVFLGGFAFSITPGKLGEVFKSVLIKQINGAPVARTAPVVFAERYTDLGGLVILASLGFYGSGTGGIAWLAGLALLLVLFVLISSRRVEQVLLGLFSRLGPLADKTASVSRALESARILLQVRNLPVLLIVSAISWFWECWALVYAARAFGMPLELTDAVFIYSLATLAGALAFLPGGLGVTEGSLVMLLITRGIARGSAGAATMLIRLTTLWFAVGIGVLALIWLDRRWKLGSRLWGGFQDDGPDCLPAAGGDGN